MTDRSRPQKADSTMSGLCRYRKREKALVTAVQIDLETDGFSYQKWGGTQFCKAGDWILNNQGDTYTVDKETFESTYVEVSPGVYTKSAPVWARKADEPGAIETKEGVTRYLAGDYLVFNDQEQMDGYAVGAKKFEEMYAPDEDGDDPID